jgi:CheY-like chemotaxis protein
VERFPIIDVRPCGRIVLIEDNPADATLFRWALRDRGVYEDLEVFDDGSVAMAFARQEGLFRNDPPPDVVVVDLALPGYDGMEVVESIRGNPLFSRTMVWVYSASLDPADRSRAIELGADSYIQKPKDLDELRTIAARFRDLMKGAPGGH